MKNSEFHFSNIYFKSQFLVLDPNPLIFPNKLPCSGFTILFEAFVSHSALEKLHTYMKTTHMFFLFLSRVSTSAKMNLAGVDPAV